MCQAKRDGGRRCPIHRHDSVAVITLATKSTELSTTQVEHTFRELNREGRDAAAPTKEQWEAFKQGIRDNLPADMHGAIIRNLDKADKHSELPDGKTFYAMTKLAERAETRNTNLTSLIERTAQEKGYTVDEVKAKFNASYDDSKREYGQGRPDGYTQSAYLWAKNNSLPYDTQSVVAIDSIRRMAGRTEGLARVTRIPTGNRVLSEIGYNVDGGRLEVKMGITDRVVAYRNVPVEVYESLVKNGRPTEDMVSNYTSTVLSNSDYRYDDADEADTDKEAVRCTGCGQFASPTNHSCPESQVTDEQVAKAKRSLRARLEEDDATAKTSDSDSEEEKAVYNPASPKKMWSEDDNKQIFETDVYTVSQIAEMGGFDKFPEGTEGADEYHMSAHVVSSADRGLLMSSDGGYSYVMRNIHDKELVKSEILNKLNGSEAVRFVTAQRSFYYHDENGDYKRHAEERIVSIENVPNYGSLSSARGGYGYGWTRSGEVKMSRVAGDIDAYQIDNTGDFQQNTYSNETNRIQSDGAPVLNIRSTYTRNITFDAAVGENHSIKIPTINELRRTMRDNDRFYMPVEVTNNGYGRAMRDDQGRLVSYSDMGVEGYIEYKKDEEGNWNSVKNIRSLKCYCNDYRRNYNCHHMDAVARKADNILSQSGAATSADGRSASRLNLREMDNGQYLTATLARRADLTITPPNEEKGQELHYKFATMVSGRNARNRQLTWYRRNDLTSYFDKVGNIKSFDDYVNNRSALYNRYNIHTFHTVDKPREIEHALRRGVAEVPVEAAVGTSWYGGNRVEGTVSLKKDEDGKIVVHGNTLKCNCGEYQEKYDCPHVRATLANSVHIPAIGSRDYDAVDNTHNRRRFDRNSPEMDTYEQMFMMQRRNPDATEEELRSAVKQQQAEERERQARREIEERERRERWEVEERERRIRQREERRAYYENLAKENRNAIETYKKANPEYAEALEAHRENLVKKWDESESSYVEDKSKMDSAIKAALDRKKKGEDAVQFRAEGGVLDGASEGVGGRKFGVELEFKIKSGKNRSAALRAIAKDLHAAGLTSVDYQQSYHSAAVNGYSKWSFEEDCTVHGELVSPILDDSPESWRQLKVATDIINKHGGEATTEAGSHVHVSTGSYEDNTAKAAELLRVAKENEDLVYRLASNPARGKHRGTQWCRPNVKDEGGDIDSNDLLLKNHIGHHGHGNAMNIDAISNDLKKSNSEFRVWDGTLNPGVIQAQVMMSVAMVDKAEYNVLKNGSSKERQRDKDKNIGFHRTKGTDHAETHNEGGIAEYLDTFFRKDEDKNQIASLFAVTKWQEN